MTWYNPENHHGDHHDEIDALRARVASLTGALTTIAGEPDHAYGCWCLDIARAALAAVGEDESWGTGKSNRELLAKMEGTPETCPTCGMTQAQYIANGSHVCFDPWHTDPTPPTRCPQRRCRSKVKSERGIIDSMGHPCGDPWHTDPTGYNPKEERWDT